MQLPKYNCGASEVDVALEGRRKKRSVEKKGAIITAHGIWTEGHWQEGVSLWIQKANFIAGRVDYGNHLLTTPLPFQMTRAVRRMEETYNRLSLDYKGQISIIAHSYGSLAVANLLARKPSIKFKRIILYGSVIDHEYPWPTVYDNEQFVELLHEFGGNDIYPKIAPWGFYLIRNSGNSGAYGFDANALECFHQFRYPDAQHSDLQTLDHFRDVWIPFIDRGCSALSISKDYVFKGR